MKSLSVLTLLGLAAYAAAVCKKDSECGTGQFCELDLPQYCQVAWWPSIYCSNFVSGTCTAKKQTMEGCHNNAECASNYCYDKRCVMCYDNSQCTADTEICDANPPPGSQERFIPGMEWMFGGKKDDKDGCKRDHWRRKPTFSCIKKATTGQPCVRSDQCATAEDICDVVCVQKEACKMDMTTQPPTVTGCSANEICAGDGNQFIANTCVPNKNCTSDADCSQGYQHICASPGGGRPGTDADEKGNNWCVECTRWNAAACGDQRYCLKGRCVNKRDNGGYCLGAKMCKSNNCINAKDKLPVCG